MGRHWPFQRNHRQFQGYEADYSDNEDDDTAEEKNVDKVRRHLLWDVILEQVDGNLPNCMATIALIQTSSGF